MISTYLLYDVGQATFTLKLDLEEFVYSGFMESLLCERKSKLGRDGDMASALEKYSVCLISRDPSNSREHSRGEVPIYRL